MFTRTILLLPALACLFMQVACKRVPPQIPASTAHAQKHSNNKLYGTEPGYVYINTIDSIFCINTANGVKVWSKAYFTASTPAVSGGLVYFGSFDGRMYALDAFTGAFKWSFTTTKNAFWGAPLIFNGLLYAGGTDGNLYAMDAVTGASRWIYPTGNSITGGVTLYHIGGKPYVFAGNDGDHLYAVDANSGALIWKKPLSGPSQTNPYVYHDRVYFITPGPTTRIAGKVYCLNAATGAELWTQPCNSYNFSSPSVNNGSLFYGAGDGFYKLDAISGTMLWATRGYRNVWQTPVFYNNEVYYGDAAALSAARESDGIGTHRTFDFNVNDYSGPTVANIDVPTVYITGRPKTGFDPHLYLYAIDPATFRIRWKCNIGEADKGLPVSPVALDAATGTVYNPGVSGAN